MRRKDTNTLKNRVSSHIDLLQFWTLGRHFFSLYGLIIHFSKPWKSSSFHPCTSGAEGVGGNLYIFEILPTSSLVSLKLVEVGSR